MDCPRVYRARIGSWIDCVKSKSHLRQKTIGLGILQAPLLHVSIYGVAVGATLPRMNPVESMIRPMVQLDDRLHIPFKDL